MRFLGLGPSDAVPDASTLGDIREALIVARALDRLFGRLDRTISEAGYLPMSGQIVDATLVAAPKQRNTGEEKAEIKAGRVPLAWRDKPAKLRQEDRAAGRTVKFTRARPKEDGARQVDIAIPAFLCKSHVSVDLRHKVIRRQKVTDAAAGDGARPREGLIDPNANAGDVRADSACRSHASEQWRDKHGKSGRIHHRKPKERPMPEAARRANGRTSKVRARAEHVCGHVFGPVFAEQKQRMGRSIRPIGIARAEAARTLSNLADKMKPSCWLDWQGAPA